MNPTRRSVASLLTLYVYLSHLACLGGCSAVDFAAHDGEDAKVVRASSREDALDPTVAPLHPVSQGQALRPTPASFDVSPNGAATWRMPVWTPPGRNGIEPNLAITYNSKAGSGWLGLGFGVTGFSTITRCWKTPAQDGTFSPGPLPDEFCLDGERLVQGTSIDNLTTFTPEFHPGTRVQITGKGTRQDPEAFEVRTADGRIQGYGSRDAISQSQVKASPVTVTPAPYSDEAKEELDLQPPRVIAWNIDKTSDRWGNYMLFNYARTAAPGGVEVLPTEIRWTGHALAEPTRSVQFLFDEPRADVRTGFRAGVPIAASRRLTGIRILAADRLTSDVPHGRVFGPLSLVALREYRFAYEAVAPGTRALDRVASLQECVTNVPGDMATLQCLDPYHFQWNGLATPIVPTFSRVVPPGASSWSFANNSATFGPYNRELATDLADLAVGDFNGDGRDDIIFRVPVLDSNSNVKTAPIGFLGVEKVGIGAWQLSLGSQSGLSAPTPSGLPTGLLGGTLAQSPRVLDLEGRGRSDVVLNLAPPQAVLGLPGPETYAFYGFSPTGAFVERPLLGEHHDAPTLFEPVRSLDFVASDFNGDGLLDVLRDDDTLGSSAVNFATLTFRRGKPGPDFFSKVRLFDAHIGAPVEVGPRQERLTLDCDGNGQVELMTKVRSRGPPLGTALPQHLASVAWEPGGSDVTVRQTSLHSMPLGSSVVWARLAGVPLVPQSWILFDGQFSRWFADLNGDGLADSVSIPHLDLVSLGPANQTLRPHTMVSFPVTAINIGGDFRAAQGRRLDRTSAPGPSLYGARSGLGSASRVDPGIRIVDIDGDGRQDILLVGPSPRESQPTGFIGPTPLIYGGVGSPRSQMTTLRWNGDGFDAIPLGIPITDFGHLSNGPDVTGPTLIAGYGPRMTRIGDFDGDGNFDIVTTEETVTTQTVTRQLVVYRQNPRDPDVVTRIYGGPHVPALAFDYEYGGPNSPLLYAPGAQCAYPQRCNQHLGWVVKGLHAEATDFNMPTPTESVFAYSYADARVDVSGRGFLGVRKHTRTDVTESRRPTRIQEFDNTSTVSASGASSLQRYAYSRTGGPTRTHVSVPLPLGSHETDTQSEFSLVESSGVYRIARQQDVTTESEGEPVRSQRVTRMMDDFGSPITVSKEESEGAFAPGSSPPASGAVHGTTWATLPCDASASGAFACSDASAWLLSRYPGFTETSSESGPVSTMLSSTRTTALEYEPSSTEARTITMEPNGPSEGPSTSGTRRAVTLSRDAFGNVVDIADQGSGVARHSSTTYDSVDHIYPIRDTDAEGNTTRRYYHAGLGVLIASDDAAGIRTQVEYDALLRPRVLQTGVRASNGLIGGHREEWSYTSDNQALPQPTTTPLRTMTVAHTSEISGPEKTQLDPNGRVLRSTVTGLHSNAFQTFAYDRFGRQMRATLPATTLSSLSPYNVYSYDLLGRLLTSSRPGAASRAPRLTTTFSYGARKTTQVSERSIATSAVVDAKGRLIEHSTKDLQSGREVVTKYKYGPFDVLLTVEHPPLDTASLMNPPSATATLTTRMVYDVLGRRQELSDPDVGTIQFLYNAFGEVKRKTDGTSSFTQYTYDKLGRPKTVVAPASAAYPSPRSNGDALNTTYVWDSVVPGKLSSVISGDKIDVQFGYDAFSRPETTTWTVGGSSSQGTFSFRTAYDSLGRLYTLTYPGSSENRPFRVRYGYAANGEVETIFDASSPHSLLRPAQEDPQLWKQVSRNAAGLSTEEQFGTTESVHRIFDTLNQVRIIQGTFTHSSTTFQHLAYQWGADGFMTARTDLELGLAESFKHDFLGRVTEWTVNQNCNKEAIWRYAYDDWGNLRSRTRFEGAVQVESIINKYTSLLDTARPHAVKQLSEATTSASATSTVTSSYNYDDAGNMKSGRDTTFTWTPFGLPRKMEKAPANAASTFLYDGFGARVLETQTDLAGKQPRDILTLGGLYERRTSPGREEHTFNVMSPNGIVAQVRRTVAASGGGETLQFIHSDHLGSSDVVTDSTGSIVDRAKYEPFGERRYPWAVAQTMAQTQPANASLGFTGQQPDNAFGLVNMKGRLYDPKLGRFISADPIARPTSEGLNRFSYVRNSPLMLTDPSGFDPPPEQSPIPPDPEGTDWVPYSSEEHAGGSSSTEILEPYTTASRTSDPSSADYSNSATVDDGVTAVQGLNQNIVAQFQGDTKPVAEAAVELHPFLALHMAWSGKHALGSDASIAERGIAAGAVVGPGLLGAAGKFLGRMAGRLGSFFRGAISEATLLSRAEVAAAEGAAGLAARFGTTAERAAVLERAITSEGALNTSQTVARQLAGQRSFIPSQSILDAIGSGTRIADPQGVGGQFMYRSAASFNGSQGTLEVLIEEASGEIRHVLFRAGVVP